MKKIKNLLIFIIVFIVSFNIKDVYASDKECVYSNINSVNTGSGTVYDFGFEINGGVFSSPISINNANSVTYQFVSNNIGGTSCPTYFKLDGYSGSGTSAVFKIKVASSLGDADYKLMEGVSIYQGQVNSQGNNQNSNSSNVKSFLTYLPYNISSGDKIVVQKQNSGFAFYVEKNKTSLLGNNTTEITVTGLSNYITAFQSGDVDKYPTWINASVDESGNTIYTLSNKRDELAKINYICQPKILSVSDQTGNDTETCETLFGSDFLKFLNNNVFTIVRIAIPLLLILFTTFDFAKVIFVDDKDGIQKAGKRFGKRIVAAILVFLIPQILIWLAGIIGADKVNECAEWMENNQSTINDISDSE